MKCLKWSNKNITPWMKEKVLPYSSIDKRLQRRIEMDSLVFSLTALISILVGMRGDPFFIFMGLLLLSTGLLFAYRLYYLATRNMITEITGVITNIEKSGYRKQRKYLHIQDASATCYRVEVGGNVKRFRLSNTVSVFIKDNTLGEYIDGEYRIHTPLLVSIKNASVTEEDNIY